MQFIDLAQQQTRIKDKIDANIQKVLAHGSYILGPEIAELEINPVVVSEHSVAVLDVTVRLAPGTGRTDAGIRELISG